MNIEDIWSIKTWGQLAFDPLRPRLFFTESVPDRRKNRMSHRIMMMDTGPSRAVAALTAGPSDQAPAPSPDGRWLGFVSRRSGSAQVWRLPLDGGDPEQVTYIQGGIKQFQWAPDGRGMVVVAHIERGLLEREKSAEEPGLGAPDSELERYFNRDVKHIVHQYYKLDGTGYFDQGRDQLVWVAMDDGHMELLTSGFDHFSEPAFSPDGESIFFVHRPYDPDSPPHPSVTSIERMNLKTRERFRIPLPEWMMHALAVSPDGQSLAFVASKPEDHGYGLAVLYRLDMATNELIDLSSATDRPVGDESGTDVPGTGTARPIWRNDQVLMLLSDRGRVTVTEFDRGQTRTLFDEKRVVYDFACQGDSLAMAVADPTHPSGIVLATVGAAQESPLWAPVPWSEHDGPVAPEEIWAEESDGTRVHTWCLRPPHHTDPVPVVLEIHGGPMAMYGYRYFHEFQCLVAAGYAVVYTNPRGSQGYGWEFCRSIMGNWGDKDYRDVMAGLDAALKQWPDLDPERLGVAGGSYGGFMVNWIVSHTDRFRAAVTMRSVVNRFSAMGSSDLGWLRVPQYGSKPWWEDPAPYWQQSPLKYASDIHTPLLIEHQEQDYRLPVEQGEQLYSALKYLGRTVEMVLYPNESHGMSRTGQPWHRVHRLRTIIGWFDRYLETR
ncbi:MAG: S9 family peptidase [Firmicutes bacterium]|nr:S9 family peptidase [Bacillota bacterium]